MLQHNANGATPSEVSKSKAHIDVIDLVSDSDSEDGDTLPTLATALKRRASNISGSHEANPRPIKKPSLQARKSSSSSANGNVNNSSRLEVAQKQTRLANGRVAELEAKLREVNAELLATKNTLSHRDAEVTSYQHMEAELLRAKEKNSRMEIEVERVTKENTQLLRAKGTNSRKEVEIELERVTKENTQLGTENQKLATQLEHTARDVNAIVASRVDQELAAAQAHIDQLQGSLSAANLTLDQVRSSEKSHIRRITQLEEGIHDLETVRDGLETTNEEIMTKLGDAEAKIKAGEAREKVAEEKTKEHVAELLNEIAAVKIEVILLTDKKEQLEIHHSQEISKAAFQTDSLKEKLLHSEKAVERLQNRIDGCSICSMNYQERMELWQLAQDVRALIRSHREERF